MYNPKSSTAEEFIDHNEVLDTLRYAQDQKNNLELMREILKKAAMQSASLTYKQIREKLNLGEDVYFNGLSYTKQTKEETEKKKCQAQTA